MVEQNETNKVFIMEVFLKKTKSSIGKWYAVKRSDGKIYTYKTKEKAEDMLSICYPRIAQEHARVTEVNLNEVNLI